MQIVINIIALFIRDKNQPRQLAENVGSHRIKNESKPNSSSCSQSCVVASSIGCMLLYQITPRHYQRKPSPLFCLSLLAYIYTAWAEDKNLILLGERRGTRKKDSYRNIRQSINFNSKESHMLDLGRLFGVRSRRSLRCGGTIFIMAS